jgi:hypothetical protein
VLDVTTQLTIPPPHDKAASLTADQAVASSTVLAEAGRNRYRVGIKADVPLWTASFGGVGFQKFSEKVGTDPTTGETTRAPRRGLVCELAPDDLRRVVEDARHKVLRILQREITAEDKARAKAAGREIVATGKILRTTVLDVRSRGVNALPGDMPVWVEPPAHPGDKATPTQLAAHADAVKRCSDRSLIYVESNPREETSLPTTFEGAIQAAKLDAARIEGEFAPPQLGKSDGPESFKSVQKAMGAARRAGARVTPQGEISMPTEEGDA